MKFLKWLDEHFEETLLAVLLVLIACVELLQVVFRNLPFVDALTWAEEFCRFCWVWSVFLVGIAVSIPIGTSMVLGSLAPILLLGKGGTITQVLNNTFSGANSTPILAVPLFILGGVIMAEGGISKKLFNFFAYFVGRIPGGVPCAVIMTCLFYGAISGSGPATTAAVGSMCIPFMVALGYDRRWSAGLIAVAGGLGVIIPPSIPFVLYSLATGVSTGALFLGGILIGLFLMAYAVLYCKTRGEDRALNGGNAFTKGAARGVRGAEHAPARLPAKRHLPPDHLQSGAQDPRGLQGPPDPHDGECEPHGVLAGDRRAADPAGMGMIEYDAAFYDSILELNGVKALCSKNDASTNGLAKALADALA